MKDSNGNINYQALRDEMASDFRDRIIEDGWGRHRVSNAASERYGFEVSRRQAREVINRVREEQGAEDPVEALHSEFDSENGRAKAIFSGVPNPDEILIALGINEEEWAVHKCQIKPYQQAAKIDKVVGHDTDGDPIIAQEHSTKQLYSALIDLRPREPFEKESYVEDLLERIENRAPAYVTGRSTIPESGNLARLLIPDVHIGKDGFNRSWGIESAFRRVMSVVDDFASLAETHNAEMIRVPFGHDWIHVDREVVSRSGTQHTTTGGTPVERSHPWLTQFDVGCDLLSAIIRRLLKVAPVGLIVVPGNHPAHSELAIARVAMAEFSNSPDVTFDRGKEYDRFSRWGVNGFMDTHGDNHVFSQLPLDFANQRGELWGQTVWHEVNTGHKHISKKKPVGFSDNGNGGCMVRISPSLSPQDAWHSRYNYHGMPGAEMYLYNKERPGPFASYQRFFASEDYDLNPPIQLAA